MSFLVGIRRTSYRFGYWLNSAWSCSFVEVSGRFCKKRILLGGRYSSGIWTLGRFGAAGAAAPSTIDTQVGQEMRNRRWEREEGHLLRPSASLWIFALKGLYTVLLLNEVEVQQNPDEMKSKSTQGSLLCSALLALCSSRCSASNLFTTASDRDLANDICYMHDGKRTDSRIMAEANHWLGV